MGFRLNYGDIPFPLYVLFSSYFLRGSYSSHLRFPGILLSPKKRGKREEDIVDVGVEQRNREREIVPYLENFIFFFFYKILNVTFNLHLFVCIYYFIKKIMLNKNSNTSMYWTTLHIISNYATSEAKKT